MEEIKVGEYVRTEKGSIGKFKSYGIDDVDEKIVYFKNNKGTTCVDENEIVKHSLNIIDLIEVGDYVNEYKVLAIEDSIYKNSKRILIYKNEKEKYERWIYIQEYNGKVHTQDDIKTVVTHEQISNIEYRLEN